MTDEADYQVFFTGGVGECTDKNEKGLVFRTNKEVERGAVLEVRLMHTTEAFSLTADAAVTDVKKVHDGYEISAKYVEDTKDFSLNTLTVEDEKLQQTRTKVIKATPQQCYETICDFESYPLWQKGVKDVNVVEKFPDSRPKVVDFLIDFFIKKDVFTNQYEYHDDEKIVMWDMVKGPIEYHKGIYKFKEGSNGTIAEVNFNVVLGVRIPKMLLNKIEKIMLTQSITALKESNLK
ncbi:type II toxin-antitoxin system RatA family toxin [candidate division KSB1 bacterium]